MSKSVLGRGLGSLMNGDKPAVSVEPSKTTTATSDHVAGPGVSSLLAGKARPTLVDPAAAPNPAVPKSKRLLPTWYFLAADVLLVALAGLIVFKGQGPIGWMEAAFCVVAVGLGCVLSIFAILRPDEDS